jgi:thiamine kinase-like enzyme
MDEVPGIQMRQLSEENKAKVIVELEHYLSVLHSHRSKRLRGFGEHIIFPYRMSRMITEVNFFKILEITSETEEFMLCHNDLNQANILVDPDTLKITGIIDWEYAGFYPPEFEAPFYKRDGPAHAIGEEEDDWLDLLNLLDRKGALESNC